MSDLAVSELRQDTPGAERPSRLRSAAAEFWLDAMFRAVRVAPWFPRLVKRPVVAGTYAVSRQIRSATDANATRIFGADLPTEARRAFGKGVLSSFYDFVCDVGRSASLSREQLIENIASIEGHEHFLAARSLRKGAIIATAHMGSFEAGAAALVKFEKSVHVVFKRDPSRFEQIRSALRQKLGVIEAPVDDGWTLWLRLRDALARDEVVMLQADRVMPGQKGVKIPLLHGHTLLPTGPVKLALSSGAPIVPVFALREPDGRVGIHVEPAIVVERDDREPHPAMLRFASVLEKYIQKYPTQWLMFCPAFCEDDSTALE